MQDDICGELTRTDKGKFDVLYDVPLVFIIGVVLGQVAAMMK